MSQLQTTHARPPTLGQAERHRGGLVGRLLSPLFAEIAVEPEAAERLREAHAQGTVVHVLRSRRIVDPIYLLHLLDRLGLPKPRWMHDHGASLLPPTVPELARTIAEGHPALLFLRRPRTLTNPTSGYSEHHVETLLELQRRQDRPILLLPETLLWTKRAVGLRPTIIDAIFGDREAPGRLRELLGFLWHSADARYHVGIPVNLADVLERQKGQTDRTSAKKVRWAILHHLAREEALRTGPAQRPPARTRQMVLKDPGVRRFIAAQAERSGEPAQALEARAHEMLLKISADIRYGWVSVLDVLLDLVWNRIYDGIVVDGAGLKRVRSAARRGPVVLVPSHKSYVDFLVLSQVFFKDGLMPPHIAAGDNLDMPLVGTILRRGGAFFLRRSFRGDRLYATVFAAYVRRILKEGHAIEFFIEGGRSRTGKILPPKMGLLSMCVDPVVDRSINDLSFIPVSISYERVIEAKSYAKELHGGAKRKEDIGALLSATKVLRSQYGRVYVDFEEPISLRAFAAARGVELASAAADPAEATDEPSPALRGLVTQLGHRIVWGINAVTRATPTSVAALGLLARARRGVQETELYARADRLTTFLTEAGARLSAALAPETRREAIREAVGRLAADGLLQMLPAPDGETIIRVEDEGRRALDYYKNTILHFFLPAAIVAAAMLSLEAASPGGQPPPAPAVQARARRISSLLKHEFSFRVDQDFEANFRAATERLRERRDVEWREREDTAALAITLNGREEVLELAGLLAPCFEAYRAVLEAAKLLEAAPMPEKRFAQEALAAARKQVLEGRILRAEAAAQPSLNAAIQRFIEEGVLQNEAAGALRIASEEARTRLMAEIAGYLQPLEAGLAG